MLDPHPENLLERGRKALEKGDAAQALRLLEEAEALTPLERSYLGYWRAKERGEVAEGIALCTEAVKEDPKNWEVYLNLGRVHLLGGSRRSAIRAFQLGLRCEKNPRLYDSLRALGIRQPPPIPFLKRENPLNKLLGRLLKRMGKR